MELNTYFLSVGIMSFGTIFVVLSASAVVSGERRGFFGNEIESFETLT